MEKNPVQSTKYNIDSKESHLVSENYSKFNSLAKTFDKEYQRRILSIYVAH